MPEYKDSQDDKKQQATDHPSTYMNVAGKIHLAIEVEEFHIVKVLGWLSYGAIFFLFAIGFKAWFSHHHDYAISLFLFGLLFFLNIIQHRQKQDHDKFQLCFICTALTLLLYLVASGGESNTGPLWFYVFPSIVFFILGLKRGVILTVISFMAIIIIFRFPELPFVTSNYSFDFQLRFIASLIFISIFAYILDYSRRKARNDLISMAKLYERAAGTDELTQLANRRSMKENLNREFFRFQRHGRYFSLILLDIDFFKKVNDTYGHDAGDLVLKIFSQKLTEMSRKVDTVARWGGEEFLILLPDTSLVQALALGERIRVKIEESVFSYKYEQINITCSAGVCSINQSKDLENLLKQADINLYDAKEKGRNRIIPAVKTHQER